MACWDEFVFSLLFVVAGGCGACDKTCTGTCALDEEHQHVASGFGGPSTSCCIILLETKLFHAGGVIMVAVGSKVDHMAPTCDKKHKGQS